MRVPMTKSQIEVAWKLLSLDDQILVAERAVLQVPYSYHRNRLPLEAAYERDSGGMESLFRAKRYVREAMTRVAEEAEKKKIVLDWDYIFYGHGGVLGPKPKTGMRGYTCR